MGFLNSLIKDPKYQDNAPRRPEEIDDPEIIISPDTRRSQRVPPGQSRTKKWPVLDAAGTPAVNVKTWRLRIEGLVRQPASWSLEEFFALPRTRVFSDFHCVTRWSRLGNL